VVHNLVSESKGHNSGVNTEDDVENGIDAVRLLKVGSKSEKDT
jgi:hypothetical protein